MNDFMGPLLYLNSPQRFTVSLGLTTFGREITSWHLRLPVPASGLRLDKENVYLYNQDNGKRLPLPPDAKPEAIVCLSR